MATRTELKYLARQRLKTARILIEAEDWCVAAYMMGQVLECALKAVICKTLKLDQYPPQGKKQEDTYFRTHHFDQLHTVSGLRDIFRPTTATPEAFRNWSDFTAEYSGDWINMRYDTSAEQKFTAEKTKNLYKYLYEDEHSIITMIQRMRRW